MIVEIKNGLADALRQILDFQVVPYMLGNPTTPSAAVFPDEPGIDYHEAMQNGLVELHFTVQVFVAETTDIGAQMQLDEYLEPKGDRSVKQALEKDLTLAGVCDDLTVTASSGYRRFLRDGGGPILGAEWSVIVYADGGV